MKGVILTAGGATRLKPITEVYGKVLVPIYNKPMIYYGISLMIRSGVKDIAIVCSKADLAMYKKLLDRFKPLSLNVEFYVQSKPLGTAHALKSALDFIKDDDFLLLLGDGIYVSKDLPKTIKNAAKNNTGITIFAKNVSDPERYGVILYDKDFNIFNMEEKPQFPRSNSAITGLYIFKKDVASKLQKLKKSVRGEYELTEIIQDYVENKRAKAVILPDGCEYLDSGTFDSLLQCSNLIKDFERENGLYGCIELELYKSKLITKQQLLDFASHYAKDYQNRVIDSIKK